MRRRSSSPYWLSASPHGGATLAPRSCGCCDERLRVVGTASALDPRPAAVTDTRAVGATPGGSLISLARWLDSRKDLGVASAADHQRARERSDLSGSFAAASRPCSTRRTATAVAPKTLRAISRGAHVGAAVQIELLAAESSARRRTPEGYRREVLCRTSLGPFRS